MKGDTPTSEGQGASLLAFCSNAVRVKPSRGFTLIELTIVIALTALAGLFMVPIGFSYVQAQLLHETTAGVMEALRKAQSLSLVQKNDHSFGVKILEDSYVLFEGDSYTTRITNRDELTVLPTSLHSEGLTEVVFEELTGHSSASGTVTFGYSDTTEEIHVHSDGLIER